MKSYRLLSRLFFRLLPYQILLIVIAAMNGIVDSLFASNVIGQDAMGAIGLYAPMNHFLYALSMMMVSGSQLLYGLYVAKEPDRVQKVFSTDLLVSGIISLLTTLLMVILSVTNATSVLSSDPVQVPMLNEYLIGQAIGIPALILGQQLFAFLSLENQTRRTTAASLACFFSNIVMDYLFIVLIPMGTFGLGLASSVSEWIFFIVQLLYYLSKKSSLKFSLRKFSLHDVPDIFRRGYSGAISRFVEMFRCLIVNALILEYVGSVGISSFAATNSLLGVIWALPFGMVAVARMELSISIGEEDRGSLTDVMRVVFRRGVPLMCAVSAILVLLAVPLTQLFYRDAAHPIFDMTVMGFRLLPLCMPLAVISLNFACFAQAAQKKVMSIVLPVVDGFAGVTLVSLILIPAMKMNGLYLANILNGVICFLVIVLFSWVSNRKMPKNMEMLLAMPESFGISEQNRMDLSVRTIEQVADVSREIMDFCTEQGIDRRRSYFCSLAMEEMAGNVVLHGFTKDRKKNHVVDIRVIHKEDEILLRIRDDCRPFDPADRANQIAGEDMTRNAGIRLVFQIAREIRYQNLLGCNVLTIKL